jgi:probable HAF family extracellular repeat protein
MNLHRLRATDSGSARASLIASLVLFAAIPCNVTICSASPQYSIIDLNPSAAPRSFATGINDEGVVVGAVGENSFVAQLPAVGIGDQGFIYSNGVTTFMDRMGGRSGSAFAINNNGQIAGSLLSPTGKKYPHAALYNSATNGTDLGTLGGDMSIAIDINDSGQIVGWAENSLINNQAFLYDHGTMLNLGTLGGDSSEALAVNDKGDVVGYSGVSPTRPGSRHAFLYTNGSMTDIQTSSYFFFGTGDSEARDINESGQVVGTTFQCAAGCTQGYSVAFVFDDGIVTALPTLGGASSYAYAINDHSQVVGHSYLQSGSYHAFIYENGSMADLNSLIDPSLGWDLRFAQDINNNGQIVGYGLIGGQGHTFLLTPIPEPASRMLLAVALSGVSLSFLSRGSRTSTAYGPR